MSAKAKAIRTLFRAKRITIEAVKKSVEDGIITEAEFQMITGEVFRNLDAQ